MKRALVISGGGSKGAFAGGVAQYLIEQQKFDYDIFVGSSTGSLLISHLALGNVEKIRKAFTTVDQNSIFSKNPFKIRNDKHFGKKVSINHYCVIQQFSRGKKTFGESYNLRNLIKRTLTEDEFKKLQDSEKDVVVTVSNLSMNTVEYKSIRDYSYDEFCDWVWISCNFMPFMSLAVRNHCEYADGGFGSRVPIEEAINLGAEVVDVIVLDTEVIGTNRLPSRNVFDLMMDLHLYMSERISRQNIRIGRLVATDHEAILNFYYTPTDLTTNSLIFDKEKMEHWWDLGLNYAKERHTDMNELRNED